MTNKNENLNELLGQFYDEKQSQQFKADMEFADRTFRNADTPVPDKELLDRIKANIASQRGSSKIIYKLASAAAAIIIAASVAVYFAHDNGGQAAYNSVISSAVWQSYDLVDDDPELLVLQTEIDDIQNDLFAVDYAGNGELAESLDEIEVELVEVENNFWKG